MKRILLPENRRATDWTTSTTGPQTRLVQKRGVAKVTTNGSCAASEPATDSRRRSRSGGTSGGSGAPGSEPSVGVADAGAFAPTFGTGWVASTSNTLTAWIRAPSGTAPSQ